ncbi:hypothetical protein KOW79_022440 [Hemibagrus wyckioides]|uniref:C-type lectin domain-containing protein n=1 Tax=Hemibagrus wyckioides TaxID=337641 RepID=A0A9D3N0V8_9TELE|nr:hypothetical protein KOW79_022440 [Hemibagrus wyckioides]
MQMGLERDHLKARNNNLTINRDEQKATIKNLDNEIEQLQNMYNKLQNMLNTISKMRWVTFNSSFYGMSNERKSWEESRNDCMDKGANLLIINNKEEQEFIGKQLVNLETWIGLSDRDKEGDWKWVDGKSLNTTFRYWNQGEPNNADGEDCAAIYASPGTFWNDKKCSAQLPWICEKGVSQ